MLMFLSLNAFIPETHDIRLIEHRVGGNINACVRVVILGQVNLRLVVDTEIRELCLHRNSDLLSDVGHLESFLSQLPFVPMIVGRNILLDKVDRSRHSFVNHQWRRN